MDLNTLSEGLNDEVASWQQNNNWKALDYRTGGEVISKGQRDLFEQSIIAQDDDNDYEESGWVAVDTVKPCVVIDPFRGSGTVGKVANETGRDSILIELNPDYIPLIEQRTSNPKAAA